MERTARILIVEDDMIIGANLSLQLSQLGYEVTGIESRGEEALSHALSTIPDIILMDINLKGELNGIATVAAIQEKMDIPIIYLTANSDDATFSAAKKTHPKAFITKPFNKLNLQRTIALVVEQLKGNSVAQHPVLEMEVMNDRIFVRHNGKMEKLLLADILYIEADRNYCTLITDSGNYLLSSTLKTMEEKLPKTVFIRVHRSFMVNISKLDVVAEHHLEIKRKVIPLSKSQKELLMARIQTI
ncbi:two component transcriptional regulator, LytTR family [Pricia antarctica]|uniref:Two component transcriptional regulator, LytTR family n=1 Tax=Pricia antarctica TaxID=641691 RepID=A0A1G7FRY8_9FLAO|nr:response regulator [Pricia antarctica]SDE78687.1 two component transcriptional regulator, LytTR family [Pricia antarctica]